MKLTIESLTKSYTKGTIALDSFSYDFSHGVYGLLGPNGSGKSTFMNIITANLRQTSGVVLCNGEKSTALGEGYRAKIGYMPQQNGIYESFTLLRFLRYMAALKGLKNAESQIQKLIDKVNLREQAKQKLGSFSGGMKQRALVAQALLGLPKLLVLDEPTAGLDPKERVRLRELVASEGEDKIVIWATHVISDIESIAKEVLFLKKGVLVKSGTPSELCQDGQSLEEVYMDVFGDEE